METRMSSNRCSKAEAGKWSATLIPKVACMSPR